MSNDGEVDWEKLGLATAHVTPILDRPIAVGRITSLVFASRRVSGPGIGRALVETAG